MLSLSLAVLFLLGSQRRLHVHIDSVFPYLIDISVQSKSSSSYFLRNHHPHFSPTQQQQPNFSLIKRNLLCRVNSSCFLRLFVTNIHFCCFLKCIFCIKKRGKNWASAHPFFALKNNLGKVEKKQKQEKRRNRRKIITIKSSKSILLSHHQQQQTGIFLARRDAGKFRFLFWDSDSSWIKKVIEF